jgi:hypothetical protein
MLMLICVLLNPAKLANKQASFIFGSICLSKHPVKAKRSKMEAIACKQLFIGHFNLFNLFIYI